MLRRAVQKRPYDWEPLLPAVLQAYRSTPSEATGFTPSRLVFGREMRLPVDIGTPLPEPPRDIRTYANILTEDLEWAYRVAREVTGLQHRRAEIRYNERVVQKQFQPGALVRVFQRGRNGAVPSKLNPRYSPLCEVLAVRGPILSLRELASRREFTANHDAVRLSTISRRIQPVPRARDVDPSALRSVQTLPAARPSIQPVPLQADRVSLRQPSPIRKKPSTIVRIVTPDAEPATLTDSMRHVNDLDVAEDVEIGVIYPEIGNSRAIDLVPNTCTVACVSTLTLPASTPELSVINSQHLIDYYPTEEIKLPIGLSSSFNSSFDITSPKMDSVRNLFEAFSDNRISFTSAKSILAGAKLFEVRIVYFSDAFLRQFIESGFPNFSLFLNHVVLSSEIPGRALIIPAIENRNVDLCRLKIYEDVNSAVCEFCYRFRCRSEFASKLISNLVVRASNESAGKSGAYALIERAAGEFFESPDCMGLDFVRDFLDGLGTRVPSALGSASSATGTNATPESARKSITSVAVTPPVAGLSSVPVSVPDAECPIVALVVQTARYRWFRSQMVIDLPLRVAVVERKMGREANGCEYVERLDVVVDCRSEWAQTPSVRDHLELDPEDRTAFDVLAARDRPVRTYEELMQSVASRLGSHFVVLHDSDAVFEGLRYQLPYDAVLDVGHNILVRNEALCRGGAYWHRTRSLCAHLNYLWGPILGGDVPEDPVAIAKGLLRLYERVSGNLRRKAKSTMDSFSAPCQFFSSPSHVLSLRDSLNLEAVCADARFAKVNRSSSPLPQLVAVPPSPTPFVFVLWLWDGADEFTMLTVNSVLRLLPVAGLCLVRRLLDAGLVAQAVVDAYRTAQRARARTMSVEPFEFAVDLKGLGERRTVDVQDVLRGFLQLSDLQILREAKTIDFVGATFPALV